MSEVAVRVERLGKRYRLGSHQRSTYGSLRESLMAGLRAPLNRAKTRHRDEKPRDVWALRDVSFEVAEGEVLGIIGRNGAGKSTLLKILSRITEPTTGGADVYGRVGSLLEVGTGFHPELTGRENIHLSGSILGMSKADIRRRFDEIVAFSEIGQFLDTPVKRYSSGMYMRLAFSVAAHLEPDVLVVDEVLAVGDAEFQEKCLGQMGKVASRGRAVLFVSHNLGAVARLCPNSLLLDHGRIQLIDSTHRVVEAYRALQAQATVELANVAPDSSEFSFTSVSVSRPGGPPTTQLYAHEGVDLSIAYRIHNVLRGANVAFELWTTTGDCVFSSTDRDNAPLANSRDQTRHPGAYTSHIHIPAAFLRAGQYVIHLSASIPGMQVLSIAEQAITFEVIDTDSPVMRLGQGRNGLVLPILTWRTEATRSH
jgi:lipopolysaccharide transport system ATP-binding protein